ncbi:MAG: hypothetical protein ED556_12540 [Winogradskyella sp.]|uniref:LysE family transporter n=1 Tax=Winogradskyella sp. TaxID=1883156 RepID=UPI000F3C71A7|nr:LysE family transporter [Winogradskyella sp.]RNC84273.1 MAG: hypothetical protein ED556_12540 [Winogradskyella sp.]
MILLFALLGISTSIIGALPLGASNIAVINTTIKQNLKQALKIAITAGVAEVLLSVYALNYNMMVKDFFSTNQWVQVLLAITLLGIGGLLFFKKDKSNSTPKSKSSALKSKYATGFLLGLLNPPVLIYWLLVYGIINSKVAMLTISSPVAQLFGFFIGVYLGKTLTLYFYGKFSVYMMRKFSNVNQIINKVTGSLLVSVGMLQFAKLYFV